MARSVKGINSFPMGKMSFTHWNNARLTWYVAGADNDVGSSGPDAGMEVVMKSVIQWVGVTVA